MKQYMLTVHDVEGTPAPAPEVMQKMYQDVETLNAELQRRSIGAHRVLLQKSAARQSLALPATPLQKTPL